MPPLPVQPNIFKCKIGWTLGTDTDATNILHFHWTGTTPTAAIALAMATGIHATTVTNLIPLLNANNALGYVELTDLTTNTGIQERFTSSTAGTRGGPPLAAGTAVLMPLGISRRYRGGKPRVYWPFGGANDLTDATDWSGTFTTAVQSGVQNWRNAVLTVTSGGCSIDKWVNISQYHGFTAVQNPVTGRWKNVPTPRSVAIAPDDILTFHVGPKPASQRRRNTLRN
jgi:hypothetical protein